MIKLPGDRTRIAVLAIGGNAIAPPGRSLTWQRQMHAAKEVAAAVLHLRDRGYRLIVTHGNGPQVGAILLQNECASDRVPSNPLDVCVAQSQAQIGYALQLALTEELRKRREGVAVLPIVTMVLVDPEDPEFHKPSKPIGPIYEGRRATELEADGWRMVKDARGGYRRVVPSPRPLEILGSRFLHRMLMEDEVVLIAAGGGGIPVMQSDEGLEGVEAVVDKDLASSLLASDVGARLLIMVTDVPHVYLDYGSKSQRPLRKVTADEAAAYMGDGQFPPGSMGPKVQAAMEFLTGGGSRVIITDLKHLKTALQGRAGTLLTPVPTGPR
ncbi:MAG: carbamate kinase [Thermoplasmata archaeon]